MIAKSKTQEQVLRLVGAEPKTPTTEKVKIMLPTSEGTLFVDIDSVSSFKAKSNYTYVNVNKGDRIFLSKTLRSFEQRLEYNNLFIRVHRSSIINIKFIAKYTPNGYLIMEDGTVVKVSPMYKEELLARFEQFFC